LPPESQVRADRASNAPASSVDGGAPRPWLARLAVLAGGLLPVAVGIFGCFAILARTPFGARITPDAVSYLSAARNLLRGRGFITYAGVPYTDWPPLFPAAIAAVALLVGRVHRAATLLGALLFGLSAAVAGVWTRRRSGSVAAGVAVAIAAVRAVPLVYVSVYAWSEPLYILTTLLALFALAAYDGSGRRRWFALSVVLASAATMTRYVGIAGIAAGGAAMLLRRGATWRRRVVDALLFGALSAMPNVLWSIRNDAVSGHLTGDRRTTVGSLAHNVWLYVGTVGGWIIPPSSAESARVIAGSVLIASAVALGAIVWMRVRRSGELRPLFPLLLYFTFYSALLLATATLTRIDPIGDRLMSPLVLPGLVAFGCTLAAGVRRIQNRRIRAGARLAGAAVLGLWLVSATGRTAESTEVQNAREEKNMRDWRLSSVGRYLRHRQIPGTVFSNDPWALFMMTGIASRVAPTIGRLHPAVPTAAELREYDDYLGDGAVWIVWLDRWPDGRQDATRTLVALSQRMALIPVRRGADGAVYYVTDLEDPAPRGSCLPGQPARVICIVPIRNLTRR
jgi:4-amino-4-deoxy-L-arabinose transferase-like glycosyltransferase